MIMKIDLNQFEILKRKGNSSVFEAVNDTEAELVRENGVYPPATYNPGMKTIWLAVIKEGEINWYKGKRKVYEIRD